MKITISFNYTETIIPKRCRKSRPVLFKDGETTVEIREVTVGKAPIAIIELDKSWTFTEDYKDGIKVDYRWFDGQLYVRPEFHHWDRHSANPGWKYKTIDAEGYLRNSYKDYLSLEERKQDIINWANEYLYIDGVLYKVHGEPRYQIYILGMGCNHSGSGLRVDYYYNSNISHKAYFPLTKREEAIQAAAETALGRGDTNSVPIRVYNDFTILIPEAIQVNPDTQHGDGDPFMNECESIISGIKNPGVAGLVVMMSALKDI